MIQTIAESRSQFTLAVTIGVMIAGLLLLGNPIAIWSMVAFGVLVLVLLNRRAALYLVIPSIALSPEIPIVGVAVRLEDVLMVPLVCGWLARLLVFRERHGTPVDRVLFAYVAVGLISTLWGAFIGTAHLSTVDQLWSAPFHFLKRVEFVLLFLILVDTFDTSRDVLRLAYLVIVSMVALNAFSLAQFLSNDFLALAPTGAPVHEPGLASMVAVVLSLGLWSGARAYIRVFLIAVILFSLGTLPLGLGRNYFATTAMLVLYVGLFQQRWALAIVPLYLLVAPRIYPQHIIERILTLRYAFEADVAGVQNQGAALISRVMAPSHFSLLALGYSPIVGFGLASQPIGYLDNEYATQLFFTGLLGFAIFLRLASRLVRMVKNAKRNAVTVSQRGLARGLQMTLVAYAIYSIFAPSISAARAGGLFFVIVAMLAVFDRALQADSVKSKNATDVLQ